MLILLLYRYIHDKHITAFSGNMLPLSESLISDKSKKSQDHLEFCTKFKNQGVLYYFHTMHFSTSYLDIFNVLLLNAIDSMVDDTGKEAY